MRRIQKEQRPMFFAVLAKNRFSLAFFVLAITLSFCCLAALPTKMLWTSKIKILYLVNFTMCLASLFVDCQSK